MKVQDIYNLMIQMGITADFRGKEGVQKLLDRKRKKFEKLSEDEKQEFNQESLQNPYMDSGVYNVVDLPAGEKEIKKILVGIDIGPEEILIARELGDIDLVEFFKPPKNSGCS